MALGTMLGRSLTGSGRTARTSATMPLLRTPRATTAGASVRPGAGEEGGSRDGSGTLGRQRCHPGGVICHPEPPTFVTPGPGLQGDILSALLFLSARLWLRFALHEDASVGVMGEVP